MKKMRRVYLLLGSNMGDRKGHLAFAKNKIAQRAGKIVRVSSLYETAPWGVTHQDDYFNAALLIETAFTPLSLFSVLQKIEQEAGRTEPRKYAPRTLDIDLLFYGHEVIAAGGLDIPHPRLAARKFALLPLAEIAPHLVHPVLKKTIRRLLRECTDPLAVKKINETF
jgi:2-amino-4-hydroxy-6-hydroxymethyldihydropteridine diphosphokinase